jgi:hypothetical protein
MQPTGAPPEKTYLPNALVTVCSLSIQNPKIVTSTEAAHGLRANPKSSFRPKLLTISSRAAQRRNPLLYLNRSPSTTVHLSLPLPVLLHQPQTPGCPIHRALCDGWDRKSSTSLNAFVVVVVVAFAVAAASLVVIPQGSALALSFASFGESERDLSPTPKQTHCPFPRLASSFSQRSCSAALLAPDAAFMLFALSRKSVLNNTTNAPPHSNNTNQKK